MTDLLPCPFCGSSDNLTIDFVYKEDWCVECDNCHVGQHALWPSKEHAIQKWNTRTPNKPAELDAKIKRLEKLTKDLKDELMCEHLPRGSVTTFMGKKLEYWMSVYEKIERYEDALHYLIERADDSNDARYGTLSASFVRDVCSKALEYTE